MELSSNPPPRATITTCCWICGSAGPLSKEHRHKASDLRAVFGDVSPGSELYWHDSTGRKNIPIPSLKADRLKTNAPICTKCNNTLTQPHDLAWEALSKALRTTLPTRQMPTSLRARSLFPHDTRQMLLNVHLYFAKLFGGFIIEDDVPLDWRPLAKAILSGKPHADLYLRFGLGPFFQGERFTGRTQMDVRKPGPLFASFWYCVTPITVQVLLTTEAIGRQAEAWHPKFGTTRLEVIDFAKLMDAAAALKSKVRAPNVTNGHPR